MKAQKINYVVLLGIYALFFCFFNELIEVDDLGLWLLLLFGTLVSQYVLIRV